MRLRDFKNNKIIIASILMGILMLIIIFFIFFHVDFDNHIFNVDIKKIVEQEKNKYGNLEYESQKINEFVSLVFSDKGKYKSVILDTKTGKKLQFEDLILNNHFSEFEKKEYELLEKKYPSFIVEAIKRENGTKFYYVKDNEVIIFYYEYSFSNETKEDISLRINYQEVKNLLSFKPVLDKTYENEDGFKYVTDKKSIALTFDDGPSGNYNAKLLDILEKNKAHATFFMVGSMMNVCQKCVLNTYQKGHDIGSHTYEHMNISKKSVDEVKGSLEKTDSLYYKITGEHICLLRPPYGSYNDKNLKTVPNSFVLWNLDTQDWRYRDKDHIVNYIKENVSDGSIILMHELYESTISAVEEILPWLYLNGYQVVSISEMASLRGKELEKGSVYYHFK